MGLEGSIPATGWNLPQTLRELNLSRNDLKDSIPPALFTGDMPSLTTLLLSDTWLSGRLPGNFTLPAGLQASGAEP